MTFVHAACACKVFRDPDVCHENHEHLNRAKFVDCTEVYLQMIKHDDFTVSINLTD